MELIDREEALDCAIYAHDWNSYSDLIAALPTVKAIPIEKLEQIRAEIKAIETGGDCWELELKDEVLELIDKAIKEQNEC